MGNYAVLEDTLVTNTIIAESKAIAEQLTGKICVAYTTEPAEIGGSYIDGIFIKKKPYPSWIKEGESFWTAPVEYPEVDPENIKHYTWDEETLSWIEIV